MAEDRERKEREAAAGGTRKLLDEIDQKANGSPTIASPASPATPATPKDSAAPAPYAGKFDPKAIAKKAATASSSAAALGTDVPVKGLAKTSAAFTSTVKSSQADKLPSAFISTTTSKSSDFLL